MTTSIADYTSSCLSVCVQDNSHLHWMMSANIARHEECANVRHLWNDLILVLIRFRRCRSSITFPPFLTLCDVAFYYVCLLTRGRHWTFPRHLSLFAALVCRFDSPHLGHSYSFLQSLLTNLFNTLSLFLNWQLLVLVACIWTLFVVVTVSLIAIIFVCPMLCMDRI